MVDSKTTTQSDGLGFPVISPQERLNNTARLTEQTYIAIDDHLDDTAPVAEINFNSHMDANINANSFGTVGINISSMKNYGDGTIFGEAKINPYLRGAEMEIGYVKGQDKISGSLFTNDLTSGARVQYTHTFNENESVRAAVSTERVSVGYKKNNVGVIAHSSLNSNEYFGLSAVVRF